MIQGRSFPSTISSSQVRLVLLPSKKMRRKTRVRPGSSPQYVESFLLSRVNPEDVNAMGMRVRVYMWGSRMRRERLLGEARVAFDRINLRIETTMWLVLQPPPTSPVSSFAPWDRAPVAYPVPFPFFYGGVRASLLNFNWTGQ